MWEDRSEIAALVNAWGFYRDQGSWDALPSGEVDSTSYARFYDCLEKRAGAWLSGGPPAPKEF